MKAPVLAQDTPRPSSHRGDLPQRDKWQGIGDREIEDKGRGERNKGKGQRYLSQRELPLDREETGVAHRQRAVYEGKRGNSLLG